MPATAYRFGDCRIDLSVRELRRGDQLIELSPKVFDCLAYLIERRERAVGRDELVAAVWGRTEITDTLLGQTIMKARRAVGDSADEQKAIRTIPRFGYAWVAELTTEAAGDEAPAPDPLPGRQWRTGLWLTPAVIVLAGLALVLARTGFREPVAPVEAQAAVLPVEVSAPAEWSWLRLGLMDAIASRLRDGGQRVVPSDNVVALAAAGAASGAGAELVVVPSATWSPEGWHVRLAMTGSEAVEATSTDVLLAGRLAADRLLVLLGRTPPPAAGARAQPDAAELHQRAEAALLTGDLDGARRLLESAPPPVKQAPESQLQLAKIDFRAGQLEAADHRLSALLKHSSVEHDPVLRARVLNGLGHVALRHGRLKAAKSAYAQAAELLRGTLEPAELGQSHMGLGNVAQIEDDDAGARTAFAQARIAFQLAGDELALARVEANEGMLETAGDRFASGVPLLEHAAQQFARFGAFNELAMTAIAEAAARLALLEPQPALAASERAWPFRDRLTTARLRQALAASRALALDANGRRGEAIALIAEIERTADPARDAQTLAFARTVAARTALAAGDAAQAMELARTAEPSLGDADVRFALTAWLTRVRALRAGGQPREADELVERSAGPAQPQSQLPAQLYASLARAERHAAHGRHAQADAEYERALDLASRTNVPADLAEVAVSYGTSLIAREQLERASAVAGQVARWAAADLDCALLQVRLYSALGQRDAWQRALAAARSLAGERAIPAALQSFASDVAAR